MRNNLFFWLLFIFWGCNPTNKIVESPVEVREEMLDTLVVTAPRIDTSVSPLEEIYELPIYRASYTRKNDLLHTYLDLSFDWINQHVIGKAELSITPMFYPTDQLELDAKNFEIHSISTRSGELNYTYDGEIIKITLDRAYGKDEVYTVYIDYLAKPNEDNVGSSAAITSEKGLFFINPLGEVEGKPQQIWTQGETENNSRWFPTIDKPNERCTQEIRLTVQDRFVTLSNGVLASSTSAGDGLRVDVWKQDKPHAPYLFMLAIGEFAVVSEQWKDIELSYYVEKEYEPHAKNIFAHTPEMLDFFSEKLMMDYPWDKYAQVVVRDYVSGAMENTSAVIFGDFVQKTSEELIDNSNDFIVAHELIHHWFGDLVTCESWANLTMNEGFANYGEYLWFEYKYGRDEADFHRQNELFGYLGQVQSGDIHPLIHFEYQDKENMFDGHSYNKGGLVLHMLRRYLGDEAFYAGLNKYLLTHEYSSVEAHDLRLAFEDVSGEDLNWFFNQWFFEQGHPVLTFDYNYDDINSQLVLNINQVQDAQINPPIFILPMEVAFYSQDGSFESYSILINERDQAFTFPLENSPANVIIDHNDDLLCIINEEKSDLEMLNQYDHAPNYTHRINALKHFSTSDSPIRDQILNMAIHDNHWSIRAGALNGLTITDSNIDEIREIAQNDPHSSPRAAAISLLANHSEDNTDDFITQFKSEKAPMVKGELLRAIYINDPEKGLTLAEGLMDKSGSISFAVSEILANSGDIKYVAFFERQLHELSGFEIIGVVTNYTSLIMKQTVETIEEKSMMLKSFALDENNDLFKRYASTKGLSDIKSFLNDRKNSGDSELDKLYEKISEAIIIIKNQEKDPQLKEAYMFLN